MAKQDLWGQYDENGRSENSGYGYSQNSGYQNDSGWVNYDRNNRNYDPFANTRTAQPFGAQAAEESLSAYIGKTFLWMCAGLLLTFFVAYGLARSGLAYNLLLGGGQAVLLVVTIAELGLVIALSASIRKLSPMAATLMFILYAALTGVTFSFYFVMFDVQVLSYVFGVTALFFGGMAAASILFKMQLDSIRPYLFGGLILLVVFGLLSLFLNLGAFETVICYVGIAIFLAYTAYDTAKIKQNYYFYAGQTDMLAKASIFSALQLYLDFINLFLYILRLFGRRKN